MKFTQAASNLTLFLLFLSWSLHVRYESCAVFNKLLTIFINFLLYSMYVRLIQRSWTMFIFQWYMYVMFDKSSSSFVFDFSFLPLSHPVLRSASCQPLLGFNKVSIQIGNSQQTIFSKKKKQNRLQSKLYLQVHT